nr:MAG TPA: hypothetical protein [Caudoviricetes sp.]
MAVYSGTLAACYISGRMVIYTQRNGNTPTEKQNFWRKRK